MPLSPERTVFRLRRCPGDRDVSGLRELLSNALEDVSTGDIRIQSLATDYGVCNTTKTATLMFAKLPGLVEERPKQKQWKIPLYDGSTDLLLDIEFGGFTPLNDPEPGKHEFDCIVISGLASHPFGSWQPKGNDKSYMWVRDTLPRQLPHVRAILYGYDTTLVNSHSFQSIPEVASTLIDHLMPTGWQSSEMKPLVFLAHSLGGIVLKQMLVTLNKRESLRLTMLSRARGGILFGVPSQGMTQGPLLAMVKGRPNEALVKVLAKGSSYLYELDRAFANIGRSRRMVYHWAYETKESLTVEQLDDGSFSRSGPRQVLVTRESATRGLWGTSHDDVFPIDEDHSDMVKFQDGSSMCEQVVLKKLESICSSQRDSQTTLPRRMATLSKRKKPDGHAENKSTKEWDIKDLNESLLVPEWDGRFSTIEERSHNTSEWFMDTSKTNFFDWLQEDEDSLFWIHGKPGSGKSTLMKFIAKNPRTEEHITFGFTAIKVRHFFHDRGTILQKSFEGMLKSILYQIIQALPSLAKQLGPLLRGKPHPDLHSGWTVNELQRCLHLLLNQSDHDIRLFLIIDSVDEYDGGPEFISKFIKELVSAAGERTRVKVLFSSRTSTSFLDEFGDTPQICLQDYNNDDIRRYCKNRLSDDDPEKRQRLEELIQEIVDRSQGVFIWVKMVLDSIAGADVEQAWDQLQSFPDDLSTYYAGIIQNIKREDRQDAYVIFQFAHIMANPDESECQVHFMDLIRALAISRCNTYRECKTKLKELEARVFPNTLSEKALRARAAGWAATIGAIISFDMYDGWLFEIAADPEFIDQQIKRISDCSGGLVDILRPQTRSLQQRINNALYMGPYELIDDADPWTRCVQFSHRTVKDFVEMPGFKELLLGDDASSVLENGYTFLAKTYLTRGRPELAHTYCHLSEETTGNSLFEFVKTMDYKAFRKLATIPNEYKSANFTFWSGVMLPSNPITFAISYDLGLCVEDLIRDDPEQLKRSSNALLRGWPFFTQITSSHCRIIKQIIQGGYTLDERKGEFQDMMWIIGAMQYTSLRGDYHQWLGPSTKLKAGVLLGIGQDPNVLLSGQRLLPGMNPRATSVRWRAMHVADTEFAEVLLRHGADVNLEDGQGNTPLDWMLAHKDSSKGRKRRGLDHGLFIGAQGIGSFLSAQGAGVFLGVQEAASSLQRGIRSKIMFLIRNGGVCKTTSMDVWQRYIKDSRKGIAQGPAEEDDADIEVQNPDIQEILDDLSKCLAIQDTKPEEEAKSPTDSAVAFNIDEEIVSTGVRRQGSLYQQELDDDLEEIERFLASTEVTSSAGSIQEEEAKPRRLSKLFQRI
ncbi:hypothetical protein VSDG_04797 [Cytospora chrysosperma]|uniref:Nephrocystin 3-like N-terminal domain-containing protein n=1 Tax=Cytospora chrysosperma TaxID=252740 RepID=A0A423W1N3_CYTCH|nr:hypothetical protein VSDG_04797 [Valsa sordida]